jgi:predicted phosphodiesterase
VSQPRRNYPHRPTADQIATMRREYARTGSYTDAGRAIGRDRSHAWHYLAGSGVGCVAESAPAPSTGIVSRLREVVLSGVSVLGPAPAWARMGPAVEEKAPAIQPPARDHESAVIISDLHHPVHDRRAWACALEASARLNPSIVVCAGDMLDLESASSHESKALGGAKRHDDLVAAIEAEADAALREVIRPLLQAAGSAAVSWLDGNHERRAEKALAKHGLDKTVLLSSLLKLADLGIMHHGEPGATLDVLGWLVEHGDARASGGGGLYAARWRALAYQRSVIFGHLHGISRNSVPSADGPVLGVGNGCLCDIARAREWAGTSRHRWQHGLTILRRPGRSGRGLVESVEIVGGRCFVDGRLVRG